MNRQDEIRKEILFQLYADRTVPRSASLITRECKKQRMDFSEREIRAEVLYLEDGKLIKQVEMPGTGEKFYRLTKEGVDHYQENFAA